MMRLDRILIILIVNAIFWSLINSVKNNKDKNVSTRVGKTSKNNDGAESSVNAQIKMLKPKPKITKKVITNDKKEEKRLNRNKYMRIYYQNNKEKALEANKKYRENHKENKQEYDRKYYQNKKEKKQEWNRNYYQKTKEKMRESARNYYQNNKEKMKKYGRNYRQNNKEKVREINQNYYQNNKEKKLERGRKYRESRKNKKANLQNVYAEKRNDSNNEGTSFVRNDSRNKGKLPIVYEKGIQHEAENHFNQNEEEECGEAESNLDGQIQSVVKEANMNQLDLNEKYYPFDLNKKPEEEDEDATSLEDEDSV